MYVRVLEGGGGEGGGGGGGREKTYNLGHHILEIFNISKVATHHRSRGTWYLS